MDWNITRGELQCSHCAKPFQEGEEYSSAIHDRGTEFVRQDFCNECSSQINREECFSFWQTRVPVKEQEQKKFVDDEVIFNFFLRLANEQDQLKRNFRYVLALFLMRKKQLKFKDVARSDEGEALVLHSSREQEDYEVPIPQLSEEEIQQVTEEVGQILNVRL